MPLTGYLRDLDADGSIYSTCPARLVRWQGYSPPVERLLLGGEAQVVGVDENVGGNWKWLVVHVEQHSREDITKPCGRPFRWFRHLLCLPFSSTLNRRVDSVVLINIVSGTSLA